MVNMFIANVGDLDVIQEAHYLGITMQLSDTELKY